MSNKNPNNQFNQNLISISINENQNIDIPILEYNEKRVLTFEMIGEIHKGDKGKISKDFRNNKFRYKENIDYFKVEGENLKNLKTIQRENLALSKNVNSIILLTESGYLLLVKSMTDNLSWEIQKKLVDSYFKLKEIKERIEQNEQLTFEWQEKRQDTKEIRNSLTLMIDNFIQYAKEQGSKNANYYYICITKLVNLILFNVKSASKMKSLVKSSMRDKLDIVQLMELGLSENLIERRLKEYMLDCNDYKDIYDMIRKEIISLASHFNRDIPHLLTSEEIETCFSKGIITKDFINYVNKLSKEKENKIDNKKKIDNNKNIDKQ